MRLLLLLLLFVPSVASAQSSSGEVRSLAGLEHVLVMVDDPSSILSESDHEQIRQVVDLEVRRTGLSVGAHPLPEDGAQIVVSVDGRDEFGSDPMTVRLSVEQLVALPRTGDMVKVVTWDSSERGRVATFSRGWKELLTPSLNSLLRDWLTANGR